MTPLSRPCTTRTLFFKYSGFTGARDDPVGGAEAVPLIELELYLLVLLFLFLLSELFPALGCCVGVLGVGEEPVTSLRPLTNTDKNYRAFIFPWISFRAQKFP